MKDIPIKKQHIHTYFSRAFSLARTALPFLGIAFFSYMLLQPDQFQVTAIDNKDLVDKKMQAVYDELLASAKQEHNDGEIQFEAIISIEDGDNRITYTVSPGDTLSEIAKLFGTTIQAIKDVNEMGSSTLLRVGEKITIGYDKSIIHEMKSTMTLAEFASEYDLDEDDLVTLNYVDDVTAIFEEGQQIFVPLNKLEAEQRGLIEKRKFVMLDIPSQKEPVDDMQWTLSGTEQPSDIVAEQIVISAEETTKRLQEIELAKVEAEQARKRAEELEKKAQEAAIAAAQKEAEEARIAKIEAEKKAEEARIAKIEAEKKAEILAKAEEKERERKRQEQAARAKQLAESCNANQCYHEGKCRSKPAHAVCAPGDDDNAWTCESGYVDTGRACITKEQHTTQRSQATAPKKKAGVLEQRYFNPYKQGYGNGRGGGHCTHYAGYVRWKEYGIMTNWRGNAKHRYTNASNAGRQVGTSPEVGSVVVMKYGSQGWNGYGHVGIVRSVDWKSRQILIEDMNYAGRYIVSKHWIDMDSTRNPVIGYVYPRKK